MPLEAVRGAEGLTVRVVNNVNKVNEVKANFGDAFKPDAFPSNLPYRQKARRPLRARVTGPLLALNTVPVSDNLLAFVAAAILGVVLLGLRHGDLEPRLRLEGWGLPQASSG